MKEEEIKEPFCGACVAAPLALIGVGAGAYGGSSRKHHKRTKKIVFWVGMISVVISLAIAAYYLWFKKDCTECA